MILLIKQKALNILTDLEKVSTMPEDPHVHNIEKDTLWAKIVKEMKEFPKARPGLRLVYSSSLKRASKTAEIAAVTANNLPEVNVTSSIKEISLGQEFDSELIHKSEQILFKSNDQTEALEQLQRLYTQHGLPSPMGDTPENRQHLFDPNASFEGGDSTQGYASRIIRGYAGILTHALTQPSQTIEAIADSLPEPSEDFIKHVFDIQRALQNQVSEDILAFNPQLTYPPFVELCTQLKGRRLALVRHGETSFSKQKILTGGHIDTGLIYEGTNAAIETGILLKLFNKCYPNKVKIIQIYGHSAASSIVEAAICASCPHVSSSSNGQYKVAEPHIFDFHPREGVTITPVSRKSLTEALQREMKELKIPNLILDVWTLWLKLKYKLV